MMNRGSFSRAAALVAAVTLGVSGQASAQQVLFENVQVVDFSTEANDQPMDVLVSEGLIISVDPSSDDRADPSGDTQIVDGAGRYLMPGLADMHAHIASEEGGLAYLVNGITTVRNLTGSVFHSAFNAQVLSGDLPGPRIYTTGPIIDGSEPVRPDISVAVADAAEARGAVRAQKRSGFSAIKLYENLTPEAFTAAAETAEEMDMQVSAHTPRSMAVTDLLDLKIDTIEHLDGYADALARDGFEPRNSRFPEQEYWNALDETKIDALVGLTLAAGTWNSPTLTLTGTRYDALADVDAFMAQDAFQIIPAEDVEYWPQAEQWMKYYVGGAAGEAASQGRMVKALFDAGAPLLLGTDAPNPFVIPGYAIHREIENWRNAGIPLNDILRIATSEAARYLGKDNEAGRIAAGMQADLILLNNDPRLDSSTLEKPAGVMVAGHWRNRTELDRHIRRCTAQNHKAQQKIVVHLLFENLEVELAVMKCRQRRRHIVLMH